MSRYFSDEELKDIKHLRAFIRVASWNLNGSREGLRNSSAEVKISMIKTLQSVLHIARKRNLSTTAIGRAIASVELGEENWHSLVGVYGTICELICISGNPLEMRWYRVPTEYLRGNKRDWYEWKTSKADRFRMVQKNLKEIREDALIECVKPEFIKSIIRDEIRVE